MNIMFICSCNSAMKFETSFSKGGSLTRSVSDRRSRCCITGWFGAETFSSQVFVKKSKYLTSLKQLNLTNTTFCNWSPYVFTWVCYDAKYLVQTVACMIYQAKVTTQRLTERDRVVAVST